MGKKCSPNDLRSHDLVYGLTDIPLDHQSLDCQWSGVVFLSIIEELKLKENRVSDHVKSMRENYIQTVLILFASF